MDWIALALALLGLAAAVYIPLRVEYERRPRLRIERADDANQAAPGVPNWRITHVRIVNDPISGWPAKWLLRNSATGCRVRLPGPPATFTPMWDPEKEPGRFTYDVSPGSDGENVAVAMKHDGDSEAYAFGPELYHFLPGPLKAPPLRLPDTEYEVTVHAEAGEITQDETFTLRNEGSHYTGLSLT